MNAVGDFGKRLKKRRVRKKPHIRQLFGGKCHAMRITRSTASFRAPGKPVTRASCSGLATRYLFLLGIVERPFRKCRHLRHRQLHNPPSILDPKGAPWRPKLRLVAAPGAEIPRSWPRRESGFSSLRHHCLDRLLASGWAVRSGMSPAVSVQSQGIPKRQIDQVNDRRIHLAAIGPRSMQLEVGMIMI